MVVMVRSDMDMSSDYRENIVGREAFVRDRPGHLARVSFVEVVDLPGTRTRMTRSGFHFNDRNCRLRIFRCRVLFVCV